MVRMETALRKFNDKFAKTFGEGTLKNAGDMRYDVIPTGSIGLDLAMGCGGYIRGRLTELWGNESAGKTTLTLLGLAEAQKKYPDEQVAFIDIERTFDYEWAEKHGVDLNRLTLVSPETAEEVADMIKEIITSGLFSMIVVDSIGAMMPQKEIEKNADEAVVGSGAKVITRMVKMITLYAPKYDVAVILINQVRAQIGSLLGPATTRPGGFALKHATTHVIQVARMGKVMTTKGDKYQIGQEVKATLNKNKVAPPSRVVVLKMYNTFTEQYGSIGIDKAKEAFDIGKLKKIIAQSGPKYTLPNGESIHSADNVIAYLKDSPEQVEQIRLDVLKTVADTVMSDLPDLEEDAEDDE